MEGRPARLTDALIPAGELRAFGQPQLRSAFGLQAVNLARRHGPYTPPDPEQRRRELEAMHECDRNPFPLAEAFGLLDLIDPRETRPIVVDFVHTAQITTRIQLGPKARPMRP